MASKIDVDSQSWVGAGTSSGSERHFEVARAGVEGLRVGRAKPKCRVRLREQGQEELIAGDLRTVEE